MNRTYLLAVAAVLLAAGSAWCGEAQTPPTRERDVPYVPTPHAVIDKMLELADVKKDDLLYDLGCGNGRIVVAAAIKTGCKAVGYDIDPERIQESMLNVSMNDLGDLVTIEQKDIFTLDLSKANVITLYLLPSLNVTADPAVGEAQAGLEDRLERLRDRGHHPGQGRQGRDPNRPDAHGLPLDRTAEERSGQGSGVEAGGSRSRGAMGNLRQRGRRDSHSMRTEPRSPAPGRWGSVGVSSARRVSPAMARRRKKADSGRGSEAREHAIAAAATLGTQACTPLDFAGLFVILSAAHFLLDPAPLDQLSETADRLLDRLPFPQRQFDHADPPFG